MRGRKQRLASNRFALELRSKGQSDALFLLSFPSFPFLFCFRSKNAMQRLAANVRASPALAAAAAAPRGSAPSTSRTAAAPALLPRSSRPASHRLRRSAVVAASAASALDDVADAIDEATGQKTREIKAQLLDSLFGTERGLSASSEVRKGSREGERGRKREKQEEG